MSYQPPNLNPYASPAYVPPPVDPLNLPPEATAKAEAIIKDAGQFWIAILICVLCTALGSVIIGPWYLIRLWQWNSLANEYPLLREYSHHGTLAQRFQGAKIKLIIGMSFGFAILGLVLLSYTALIVLGAFSPNVG